MTESLAQEIKDRLDIQDLMHRYARMVDRRQWDLLDQVFAADATVDYASTGGKAGPCREVMAWLDRALKQWPLNLHFISNIEIELELYHVVVARKQEVNQSYRYKQGNQAEKH